jgi:hypothetical protein
MQFARFEAEINASALFVQINDKKLGDCTYCAKQETTIEKHY